MMPPTGPVLLAEARSGGARTTWGIGRSAGGRKCFNSLALTFIPPAGVERWWSKLIHLRIGLNVGPRPAPGQVAQECGRGATRTE